MIRNNAQLLIPHVNKGKLMSASPLKLVAICKFFVSFNISFFCCFSENSKDHYVKETTIVRSTVTSQN